MSVFDHEAMRNGWRLIFDLRGDDVVSDFGHCGDAAWNMAADEALLVSLLNGESLPTLRLYVWKPPAVSIGRFQPLAHDSQEKATERFAAHGSLSSSACEKLRLPVVRRMTGGRAILHDREVTYSVVAKHGSSGIVESYQAISEGLRFGLERLGVKSEIGRASAKEGRSYASCFAAASRSDLVLHHRHKSGERFASLKLAGSAQYRRNGALLQQGTIPITWNQNLFAALFGRRPEDEGAICLTAALGRDLDSIEVAEAIAEGFRDLWGKETDRSRFTEREIQSAHQLRKERYADREWTINGSNRDYGRKRPFISHRIH